MDRLQNFPYEVRWALDEDWDPAMRMVWETFLLFEAKDAEALKEAIERMLSLSEQDREVMGIAGREWVENNFDRNIVIGAYCDILKRVENKNKGEYHGTV